jgi:hypothetical protein
MTLRNLTMTLEDGRMRTWRLPRRSALTMLFYNILLYHLTLGYGNRETYEAVILALELH